MLFPAALPPAPPTPPAAAVSFVQTPTWVEFENGNGRWTIFTRCLGPRAHRRYPVTVGPGYVALARRKADGVLVTNDERRPGGGNAPGRGGLGEFSLHDARRGGPTFDYLHAWSVDGRTCSEDGWALGRPFRPKTGVYAVRVLGPPELVDGEGRLSIAVFLRDVEGRLLRVAYAYRVRPDVVQVDVAVTELTGRAFVKEPKLVAAVTGGGYTRMAALDARGHVVRSVLEENRDGAWRSPECLWMGVNAYVHSGQCDADDRARVRFDFGDYGSGDDGRCDGRCLNVAMRAVRADGGETLWENSRAGLDGWAVASGLRRPYAHRDSRLDGVRWGCKAATTRAPIVRRWELVGYSKNARGTYSNATAMFHGWEGGRGFGDCEPISRRFGPPGETWTVAAEYWFGD